MIVKYLALLLSLLSFPWTGGTRPLVHHELHVVLEPDQGRFEVEDRVYLPTSLRQKNPCWQLWSGLQPRLKEPDLTLGKTGKIGDGIERYCLEKANGTIPESFTVIYGGSLDALAISKDMDSKARLIKESGIYLDGSHSWYPRFEDEQVSFQLTVQLPKSWKSVSQGIRADRTAGTTMISETWKESRPQETIYLIAAPFHEYSDKVDPVKTLAFLRRPDPELAQRYLEATSRYLSLYSRLLGPYPYGKFALVENHWESGYGMPSFTLLGPRVIRLPFILYTSYPHEILHNWWGNGVYVDYATGNWSEGLTAYLADHWLRERRGEGADFRRDTLQRFTNYVNENRDFPLGAFRVRHSEATQSVGYDKGLMFFHMLRWQLGEETFIAGLRQFYREFSFRRAGFEDLRTVFETRAGKSLQNEFQQWLTRTGAPALRIDQARTRPQEEGFRVTAVLRQTQPGPAYRLEVPLALQLENHTQAWHTTVVMTGKRLTLDLAVPDRPRRLAVDPRFDLMRRLDRQEIPPSVGQILGAEKMLIILPGAASKEQQVIYKALAERWRTTRNAEIRWDHELQRLPAERAIWLFGWDNRFRSRVAAGLEQQPVAIFNDRITLSGQSFSRQSSGIVLVARHPDDTEQALGWLAGDDPGTLSIMAAKLRHYGKYSYLVFSGDEAINRLKGQWPVIDSPLNIGIEQWDGKRSPSWNVSLQSHASLESAVKAIP